MYKRVRSEERIEREKKKNKKNRVCTLSSNKFESSKIETIRSNTTCWSVGLPAKIFKVVEEEEEELDCSTFRIYSPENTPRLTKANSRQVHSHSFPPSVIMSYLQ